MSTVLKGTSQQEPEIFPRCRHILNPAWHHTGAMGVSQSLVWMRFLYKPAPTGALSSLQAQPGDRASGPGGADSPNGLHCLMSQHQRGSRAPGSICVLLPPHALFSAGKIQLFIPLFIQHFKQTPQQFPECFIPHILENININRSAQRFFHVLLLAKGSLRCSARLRSVVTFKGFPSLPPPLFLPLHQQITNQAVAPRGTYVLHAYRTPESVSLEKTSKTPTLQEPPRDLRAPFPPTPLPHCPSVKVQVPTDQIQRYFHIPLYFQAVSV